MSRSFFLQEKGFLCKSLYSFVIVLPPCLLKFIHLYRIFANTYWSYFLLIYNNQAVIFVKSIGIDKAFEFQLPRISFWDPFIILRLLYMWSNNNRFPNIAPNYCYPRISTFFCINTIYPHYCPKYIHLAIGIITLQKHPSPNQKVTNSAWSWSTMSLT